jgi:hypothetical protein
VDGLNQLIIYIVGAVTILFDGTKKHWEIGVLFFFRSTGSIWR